MKTWTKYTRCHFIIFVQGLLKVMRHLNIGPDPCNFEIDEDISANVTPTSPPSTHIGPVTRARARQLNYQVLSFLANPSNVHEHMMLPKIDTFVLLMSEGPSMDKEDGHWSGIKHGKDGARA